MSIDIRFPNINGKTDREQLAQMRRYLYQLVEQLNWGLSAIETGTVSIKTTTGKNVTSGASESSGGGKNPQAIFNDIKSLIIKSADIVNAYYEQINAKLKGEYLAISDFGTYKEENELAFTASANRVDALFSNTQTIQSDLLKVEGDIGGLTSDINAVGDSVDGLSNSLDQTKDDLSDTNNRVGSVENSLKNVNGLIQSDGRTTKILSTDAWIRIGAIATQDSGHYLYGMEIGQTNEVNGEVVETKFAQYTSEGIYLFDGKSNDWCAKLANRELYINEARITNKLRVGGFVQIVLADGGVVEKWMPITEEESE